MSYFMAEFKGIDVWQHQWLINWEKVKNSGVQFVMLRAGYGQNLNQKDKCFERNYFCVKAAGIPAGSYHYSYAKSVEDAKKEAELFLNIIKGK
jgi:lysozyme